MKTVLILGMHRSGTSSVARALSYMGIELGSNLLSAQNENKKGFWEDKTIVQLNTALMNASGEDWHTFGTIDFSETESLFEQAVTYLNQQHLNFPIWGFKDPRTTRLIPFWKKVVLDIGSQIQYCVVIRNPLSVMKSLEKRNAFTPRRAALLWQVYYMDMLTCLKGESFTVVDYDELMANPREELIRMSKGLEQTECISEHNISEYVNSFLSPDLRHSKFDIDTLNNNKYVPKEVSDLYSELLSLTKQSISNISQSFNVKIEEWESLKKGNSFFKLINELGESEERLTIALSHVEQLLKERDQALNERDIAETRHQMALADLEHTKHEMNEKLIHTQSELETVYNSKSWKLTGYLRSIRKMLG